MTKQPDEGRTPAQALAFPRLDQSALEAIIAADQARVDGVDVKSRTRLMLEANEAQARELEGAQADWRGEIGRLDANLEALSKIRAKMAVIEGDLTVQLAVVNTAVHSLRMAGATLPGTGDGGGS